MQEDLKTPAEWSIMEGIELLAGDRFPAELPDIPISFEVWNQMVLNSYAFRIVR